MPYPNEHACRLRQPNEFQKGSFRRTSRKHEGKTYDVISGKLKGDDAMTEQAYRYPKEDWTVSQARSHCEDHAGISFEPAGESDAASPEMERRVIAMDCAEIRAQDDGVRKLSGYAAKFGQWTDVMWFREQIKKGAFDDVLATSDCRALKNHDPNLLLGRESAGTLRLQANSVGLKFENDVPDTTTGHDTYEEVRRGDLAGCSFAFTVSEDEWRHFDDGRPSERTIVRIGQLFDVGPVTYPAYEQTTVVARSVDAIRERRECSGTEPDPQNEPAGALPAKSVNRQRQRQIEYDYQEMGRLIRHVETVNGTPDA